MTPRTPGRIKRATPAPAAQDTQNTSVKHKGRQNASNATVKRPSKKKTKRGQPERLLQIEVVNWFREMHPDWVVFSVPNEACYDRKEHFKPMGLLSGCPDMTVISPDGVVFLELKSQTGRCSTEQKAVHAKLLALGAEIHVVRSLAAVKSIFALIP